MNIPQLFQNVIAVSLISIFVTLFVAVIRLIFQNLLGPGFRYYIWFIVIVWLLIPIPVHSSFSITGRVWSLVEVKNINAIDTYKHDLLPHIPQEKRASENYDISYIPSANIDNNTAANKDLLNLPQASEKQLTSHYNIAAYVWFFGAILVLVFNLLIYIIHGYKIRKYSRKAEENIQSLCRRYAERMGLKKNITTLWSHKCKVPMLYGIFRPIIIIPSAYQEKLNDERAGYILMHELIHYKRHDTLVCWALIMACGFHWFNPIIWIVYRQFRNDRELACDAGVLNILGDEEKLYYGQAVISTLNEQRAFCPLTVSTMAGRFPNIKERIELIMDYKRSKFTIFASAAAICLTAAITLIFLSKPSNIRTYDNNGQNNSNIEVDNKGEIPKEIGADEVDSNSNNESIRDPNKTKFSFQGHESNLTYKPDLWRYIGDKAYKFKGRILEREITSANYYKYKLEVIQSYKLTNYHNDLLTPGYVIDVLCSSDGGMYDQYYQPGRECVAVIGEFTTSSRVADGLDSFWGIIGYDFFYIKDGETWLGGNKYHHTDDFWEEGIMPYVEYLEKYNVPQICDINDDENIHYIFRHYPVNKDGGYYIEFLYFTQDKKLFGFEGGTYFKGENSHMKNF